MPDIVYQVGVRKVDLIEARCEAGCGQPMYTLRLGGHRDRCPVVQAHPENRLPICLPCAQAQGIVDGEEEEP